MDMHAQDDSLEQLKSLVSRAKGSRFTILLTGSTTVNTSSATNPLFNTRILHVDIGRQGPLEIVIWERTINDLPCRIISLPGLCNMLPDTSLSQVAIKEIRAKISPVHCIWFAARLNETSLNLDEQNVIKWLTVILGEPLWNYALLIFTHSNTAKGRWQRANLMKKRSEKIRTEIAKYTGWDIAAGITSVPVTTLDEITLDGKKWLPEFYTQILRRSDPKGIATSFNLVLASENTAKKRHSAEVNLSSALLQGEGEDFLPRAEVRSRFTDPWHILLCCYLWSAPVAMIGMCLWSSKGFCIALLGNILFWLLFILIRNLHRS